MSGFWSLRSLYIAGATASILGLTWTVLDVGPLPWTGTQTDPIAQPTDVSPTPFKRSGNVSNDVQRALIMQGELEGKPGNSRSQSIKEVIKQAEDSRGLPTDGIPDQELLRRLEAELEKQQSTTEGSVGERSQDGGASSGWTIDDWERIAQIVLGLNAMFMGWLGFFRRGGRQPEAPV